MLDGKRSYSLVREPRVYILIFGRKRPCRGLQGITDLLGIRFVTEEIGEATGEEEIELV